MPFWILGWRKAFSGDAVYRIVVRWSDGRQRSGYACVRSFTLRDDVMLEWDD